MQEWWEAQPPRMPRASVLGCVAAVAGVIATTAVPVGKLMRIRALVRALGGVGKAVQYMWRVRTGTERFGALAGAAKSLASELFGISKVRSQCFN